jgi:membrane protease YdiL (CAAX protease family)
MRLTAARQVAVLAPAFAAHTAWIAPFSLRIGPHLDVYLEDAVGAVAMLWLAPRCRRAFAAPLPASPPDKQLLRPRELLAIIVALLLRYLLAGYIGNGLEQLFTAAAPAQTSARLVAQALGHLAWQVMALQLLGQRLAFFSADSGWLSIRWDGPWLRWVLAGFAASATAYSLAAEAAQLFPCPPATILADATAAESVIAPMVRSEHGLMRAAGYISSCASGPAVEEIVHRGFLLTALRRRMPVGLALPASAALFALQHGRSAPLLPLGALGLLWSLLYLGSGNLLVSMLTHGLWNLRVLLLSSG